jgi:hypothetical protein
MPPEQKQASSNTTLISLTRTSSVVVLGRGYHGRSRRQRHDERRDRFHPQGRVGRSQRAIPTAELQPVIDEVDKRARALVASGRLTRLYDEEGFETHLASVSRETDHIALAMWNGLLHGPAIVHLIR